MRTVTCGCVRRGARGKSLNAFSPRFRMSKPTTSIGFNRLRLRHIHADDAVFAAEVELAFRENRASPAGIMQGRNLPAGEFLQFLRVGFEDSKIAGFAERQKFSVREDQGTPAECSRS